MIKLLNSCIIDLPEIYLVSPEDTKLIPIGIPFIIGDKNEEQDIVKILEYELILKSLKNLDFKFNWWKKLEELGYKNIYKDEAYSEQYEILKNEIEEYSVDNTKLSLSDISISINEFIKDSSYVVNTEKLTKLKIFPQWFDDLKNNIFYNITNQINYNYYLFNKKNGYVCGDVEIKNRNKNLIIIDISASIPKSIGFNILALAKTLSFNFYSDLIITGKKSILIDYNDIKNIDIKSIYAEIGGNNECKYFRNIVSQEKCYENLICFGDNHSPLDQWNDVKITEKQAQNICKFKIKNIYSFHTHDNNKLAGYAEMFQCKNIEYISDWVTDLNI